MEGFPIVFASGDLNAVLSRYGRALSKAGRPYDHYAEIVIVLEGQVPTVRRLLLGHGLSVSSDGAAYPSPGDAMANFAGSVDRVSFFGAGILAQAWGGLAD